MSNDQREPLAISEAELRRATAALDEFHNETFPSFERSLGVWAEETRAAKARATSRRASRRTFLMGGGAAVLGGVALAACGSSSTKSSSPATAAPSATTAPATGGPLSGDAEVAGTAASLENLAVAAYSMGIQAATAGKIGTVPPAVVTFAQTAMAQHNAHAGAFNSVLTAANQSAITKPDPVVLPIVEAAFAKVTDVGGLAMLALKLENVAANTYMSDLGMALTSSQLIGALATIQPVERQHVSILYFVLGQYPVPETFESATVPAGDSARPPTDINMS
ncbi:MAG: ferritin-like domain-containing protein [Acidimicrobiales bacterium]